MKKMARWLILTSLWLCTAMAHAGTVTYVYTDPQGTPLAEADASGNITARFDYAPYGTAVESVGPAPNGPGYTGHVNDPDTGLVYMQARYYDPATGRFLSVDPVTPTAGNAFNFSRYAYANSNPVMHTDPDGRQSEDAARAEADFVEAQQANRFLPPVQPLSPVISAMEATANVEANEDILNPGAKAKAFNDAINDISRSVADSTAKSESSLRRPYIRQSTRKAVEDSTPRTADGRPIDPNTLKPIDGKPDFGHRPGNEFRREKAQAQKEGLTQKQFNNRMNDPSMYHLEDPATNRSHIYEKKDPNP
ncbi:MAG TPA: RHS repeat-associated core domain-containing protein [Rhodanobacter sp.]|nr:RHS repeat-associated core domain-containing protein [Rhodanobacter sp.]